MTFVLSHIRILLLVSVVFLLSQCKETASVTPEQIEEEVASLESLEKKQVYLERILDRLKSLHLDQDRLLRERGYERVFHESLLEGLWALKNDHDKIIELSQSDEDVKSFSRYKAEAIAIDLSRISKYFDQYGYPSRPQLGQYAALAPFALIYYSGDHAKTIVENHFMFFYDGYKYGDVPPDMFMSYLAAYYPVVKQEDLRPNEVNSTLENINSYLGLLGIQQ